MHLQRCNLELATFKSFWLEKKSFNKICKLKCKFFFQNQHNSFKIIFLLRNITLLLCEFPLYNYIYNKDHCTFYLVTDSYVLCLSRDNNVTSWRQDFRQIYSRKKIKKSGYLMKLSTFTRPKSLQKKLLDQLLLNLDIIRANSWITITK